MRESMSIGQLLTTRISLRPNPEVQSRRRATEVGDRVRRKRRALETARQRLERRLNVSIRGGQYTKAAGLLREVGQVREQERMLRSLDSRTDSLPHVFVFSSWMLAESFRICNELPEEGMHFIAGIELDSRSIGTKVLEFPYAYRSVAGAAGEHRATHKLMIEAHERGHRVVAMMHSHPGSGPDANHRSSTDERTQSLWEKTTAIIGGIWSRDGYLRWYTSALPYEVVVVGFGLEHVQGSLWRLEL